MCFRKLWVLSLVLPGVASMAICQEPADVREVKYGKVVLSIPKTWEEQKLSNNFRLAQFAIPAAEGEKPAELTIFNFGGGSGLAANVDRWKKQFAAEGRQFKARAGKSPSGHYVYVDLSGTYNKPVGPPIRRRTVPTQNSRMLGVMFGSERQASFFIKLVGPAKTVAAQVDAFRASFGPDEKSEKPFEG